MFSLADCRGAATINYGYFCVCSLVLRNHRLNLASLFGVNPTLISFRVFGIHPLLHEGKPICLALIDSFCDGVSPEKVQQHVKLRFA